MSITRSWWTVGGWRRQRWGEISKPETGNTKGMNELDTRGVSQFYRLQSSVAAEVVIPSVRSRVSPSLYPNHRKSYRLLSVMSMPL